MAAGWLAVGGCQWEAQGGSSMQGSDVELLPLEIFPSPRSAAIVMFLAPSQGVAFSWSIPKMLSPNHNQSLSEVPRRAGKAHECSWGQTGSAVLLPAIPSAWDSQWRLQEEGLGLSVPLSRKAPQDMAKHTAKHPPFGEEQPGTCRSTPAISASLPQTVPGSIPAHARSLQAPHPGEM